MQQKKLDNSDLCQSVKGHPFFLGVPFSDLEELLELCKVQQFSQAEIIFEAKKPRGGLFLLLDGIAEVFVKGDKTEEVLEVVQKGDMIGFSTLADFLGVSKSTKYEQMVEVKAIEEVTGLLIPFPVLERRYESEGVRDYLLQQVAGRLKDIYASLAEQVKLSRDIGESTRFVMRVQDIMNTTPVTAGLETTVQDLACEMVQKGTSSVLLLEKEKLVGIITERDLVGRVLAEGKSLNALAKEIMTRDPYTINRFSYFYDAISMMVLNGVKHLPVVNDDEQVVGVVTLSDLLRKRNESMMKTIQRLEHIGENNLSEVKGAIYEVLETMLEDQVPMLHTLDVITTLYDRLVTRSVELAIESLKQTDGEPPADFCFYMMGSAGRREQFILTDQDHFLVYDNVEEDRQKEVDMYFDKLGKEIVKFLKIAGYALCKGKMMSSEPNWRGSLKRWQERLRQWMLQATGDNILLAQNFFSFRMLYGSRDLDNEFVNLILEQLERSKVFLYRMAQVEKEHQVPTLDQPIRSLFRLERKKIDIKKEVLFPFHHGLQILCLNHEIASGTPAERIESLVQKGVITESFASDLTTAFNEVMMIYVKQKYQQYKRGEETSSVLTFTHLTTRDKEDLILTLKTFRELQGQMFGGFSL